MVCMIVNTYGLTEIFIVDDTVSNNVGLVEFVNHKTMFPCINPLRLIRCVV